MLGISQWNWLESEKRRKAKIRLILGGTQILREHNGYEAWANFPLQLERLVALIKKTRANGVMFLTGDTHWAELTRREWEDCYPLYDLTSSGLTEVWKEVSPNRFRLEDMVYLGANFGSVKINWDDDDPTISLSITDESGAQQFTHEVRLSAFQF